jgi:subtilisin family serine protease
MTKAIGNPPGGSAGVAYNADLFFVRSTGAPLTILIDAPSENTVGVRKSLEYLATRSDVKIISMSQGGVVSWWGVKRAVRMCNDSGKLIFFAGGTFIAGESLSDLIFGSPSSFTLFPARLSFDSNEDDFEFVFSVTGIESTNNIAEASWCPECFGRADFVVEFSNGGSSSHSTSHTAGMAALIWSDNVNQTREQVLAKMIAASDRSTANRSPDFGYGRVNMQQYLDIR